MVDRQPTFPTEEEFRGYLGQTNLGRNFLGIFDKYAEGLETQYRTSVEDILVDLVEETATPIVSYKGEIKKTEHASLHTTDFSHSDFPSLDLGLWVEDGQLILEFDPYATGGDDIIRLHAYLDSGKVEVELPGNYKPDQHKPEFRKMIDRIQRFSSVGSDLLDVIDTSEAEPEEPEEKGE